MWIIIFLGSTAYMTYLVTSEMINYYNYPTMTGIRVEYVDELQFPAVTICNLSPFNSSAINADDKLYNYYQSVSPLLHMAKDIDWTEYGYDNETYFDPLTTEHILNISMDKNKMFTFCMFDGITYDICSHHFEPSFTAAGLCYTWNGDGKVKTRLSGHSTNLYVNINIFHDLYFWGYFLSAGIKVVVHKPGNEPDTLNDGFFAAPGISAFGRIYTTKYKFLPLPYKSMGNEFCVDTNSPEFNPINGTPYSYSGCLHNCRLKSILDECGCLDPSSSDTGPFCSRRMIRDCLGLVYYKTIFDPSVEKKCECPMPCESTTYQTQVSSGYYPSKFVLDYIYALYGKFDFRKDYMELRLYFDSHLVTTIEQLPQYSSVGSVLANVGGQIGLFLGASIISVIELLEFLVAVATIYSKKFPETPVTRMHPKPNAEDTNLRR